MFSRGGVKCFCHIFILTSLLGEDYFYYGYNVYLLFINKRLADPSPLIFPRFTKCNLMHHAFTGDLTVSESYCRLILYFKMSFSENICLLQPSKNDTVCQIIPSYLDLVILHCSFELFLVDYSYFYDESTCKRHESFDWCFTFNDKYDKLVNKIKL